MNQSEKPKLKGTKRLFLKLGSCSRTLGYIINREFDELKENEERALDPLAGGIIRQGYQCGMLWGSTLAAGAEAYRRTENEGQSIALRTGGDRWAGCPRADWPAKPRRSAALAYQRGDGCPSRPGPSSSGRIVRIFGCLSRRNSRFARRPGQISPDQGT